MTTTSASVAVEGSSTATAVPTVTTTLPLPGGTDGNFTVPGNDGNSTSDPNNSSTSPNQMSGANTLRLDLGLVPFLSIFTKRARLSASYGMDSQSLPHQRRHDETHTWPEQGPRTRDLDNISAMIGFISSAVLGLLSDARVVATVAATTSPFLYLILLDQLL